MSFATASLLFPQKLQRGCLRESGVFLPKSAMMASMHGVSLAPLVGARAGRRNHVKYA